MNIITTEFIGSFINEEMCPQPVFPEYAFIGRSNVGKSSLINMLTNKKGLAKISNTPGKTQTINHFLINNEWYLVDLPGYGYAKISYSLRTKWENLIKNYLNKRENLQCVFLLIDSRLSPQKSDILFANWLGEMSIPFIIIFTKSDKQGKIKTLFNVDLFKKEMLKHWEELPRTFITSSKIKMGREVLLKLIDEINHNYLKSPVKK